MTYGVWDLALPIPLRVQFSDKQKHIQALASHFTLCALAGGDAFLEPLAYSPKNGSSWLSFKKQKRKTGGWWWWGEGGVGAGGRVGGATFGGLGSIFHPAHSPLSARPLIPRPSLLLVRWWTNTVDKQHTCTFSLKKHTQYTHSWHQTFFFLFSNSLTLTQIPKGRNIKYSSDTEHRLLENWTLAPSPWD